MDDFTGGSPQAGHLCVLVHGVSIPLNPWKIDPDYVIH